MNVTPLAPHSTRGVRAALGAHAWEPGAAETSATGAAPLAFHLTGLDDSSLEALVHFGGSLGLDVITGDGWAVIAGSRSRLSALARPWTAPEQLREVARQVGLALPADLPRTWRTARGDLDVDGPVLVGILNITPDSFSDGGRFATPALALERARELVAAGAHVLDVGGESTRPGRDAEISAGEEIRRVVPVIDRIVRELPAVPVSVDTMKAPVAEAALAAGAAIVNDVTGLRHDPAMAAAVGRAGAGLILMHSRGPALEIAALSRSDYGGDIVGTVLGELRDALGVAGAAGVAADAIVVDPGLGFAKTPEQNIFIADQIGAFLSLGRPVLVGPSRKRFLGAVTGRGVDERDVATAAVSALCYERGARLFRVHDVAAARDALAIAQAFGGSPSRP